MNKINLKKILKSHEVFSGCPEDCIEFLAANSQIILLEAGQEVPDLFKQKKEQVYLILNGSVTAGSSLIPNQIKESRTYHPGDFINVLALFHARTDAPQIHTLETTKLLIIDLQSPKDNQLYQKCRTILSKNLIKFLYQRLIYTEKVLSITSDIGSFSIGRQIEEIKARLNFGNLLVRTIIVLCIYTLILAIIEKLKGEGHWLTTIMIFFSVIYILSSILKMGLPLSEFGITMRNWKRSMSEGLIASFTLILIMIISAYLAIKNIPALQSTPLIHFDIGITKDFQISSWEKLITFIIYILFVPMQEFFIRGALQTSLYLFLSDHVHKKTWTSIIVSNFLFITFHAHYSLIIALLIFIPGIVWGWIYARNKTLFGSTISHMIIGCTAFFIINLKEIFIKLQLPDIVQVVPWVK